MSAPNRASSTAGEHPDAGIQELAQGLKAGRDVPTSGLDMGKIQHEQEARAREAVAAPTDTGKDQNIRARIRELRRHH
jgi:hypothetical protein